MAMCIDYRHLNKVTTKNHYPIPRIDDKFDQLQGAIMFSMIDMSLDYHYLRIRETYIPKNASNTRQNYYDIFVISFVD